MVRAGCLGSQGVPQLSVAPGSTAILGQTLQMLITNVPTFGPFASAFGVIGVNRTLFTGFPIPFELTPFGLSSCFTWTSADLTFQAGQPVAGVSTWNLALPLNTGLLGFELSMQGFCFESPAFSRWATVSNALFVRCGNS